MINHDTQRIDFKDSEYVNGNLVFMVIGNHFNGEGSLDDKISNFQRIFKRFPKDIFRRKDKCQTEPKVSTCLTFSVDGV